MIKKLLKLILFVSLIASLVIFIWQNKNIYLEEFDLDYWSQRYEHSQYTVPQNEYWGMIDDPQLYSVAGWRYLHGADPTSINFESQPLTKYFFGLSILFFGNAAIFQLVSGISLLVLLYFAAKRIYKSSTFALIPPLLLSVDLLFKEQLLLPYLDLFQALAIQVFLFLLLLSSKNPKYWKWASIALGLAALSKSFMIASLLFGSGLLFLYLLKREGIVTYIKHAAISILVYLLGYLAFFLNHPPQDIILLHIRTLRFYKGYVPEYPKGEIFRIIFTGWWRKWFDDFGLMRVNTWSMLWPISLVASLFAGVSINLRNNPGITLHLLWIGLYMLAISLKLVFPRYLMPILPSLYLITAHIVMTVTSKLPNKWVK